jgi:phytoene synthase
MTQADAALPPLAHLLAAHAGHQADRHRAIWAFDARLASVARTTSEAMIGQMRLAWWTDVIDDPTGAKGRGEPVVDALRATGAMAAPGLPAAIDGWEVLVVEAEIDAAGLDDYADGRGGGLFRALADAVDAPDWLIAAGRAWALWDLAGHVGDAALAQAAIARGRALLSQVDGVRWPREWKPLRIAFTLARQDLLAGRGAEPGMPRAQALRLLRIALVGR